MSQTRRDTTANPISWLHVLGFVVVLWAASSDVLAQALVTEVQGNVLRGANRVQALEPLKAGERLRLNADSKVSLFVADDAQLYVVRGPAEVMVGNRTVTANGQAVSPMKLHDAYKTIKAGGADMVQGSMVMRMTGGPRVRGPEGVVLLESARAFSWTAPRDSVRFELATQSGDVVYRAAARGGALTLPGEIRLVPGERYVWGIFADGNTVAPLDWTEFSIASSAETRGPGTPGSAGERVLYAAWLSSQGLERAASRTLQSGRE